ncbi:hypothetical protein BC830DRAFT_17845 [Chytriomyces sp. MP71]|nr:hypothetical protein BC830DRAFT_17845 [Chytriomyces sp. MP71]
MHSLSSARRRGGSLRQRSREIRESRPTTENRIAQRLHRERKTQYVKDLEAKVENLTKTVETLESTRGSNGTSKTSRETKLLDALKQKISELEAENSSLRQVAFGFDLQQTTGVWVNDGSSTSSPSIVPLASPAQQQAFLLGGMPSPSSPLNSSPLNGVPHHVASFGFTF